LKKIRPRRRAFEKGRSAGQPKFDDGDQIGDFKVVFYQGHSDVNKRNSRIMDKPQHWYRCICKCGTYESRSQQELVDKRREQKCRKCRTRSAPAAPEATPITHIEETA